MPAPGSNTATLTTELSDTRTRNAVRACSTAFAATGDGGPQTFSDVGRYIYRIEHEAASEHH